MATPQEAQNFRGVIKGLPQVDLAKLTRSGLGEESLSAELEPRLKKVERLKSLAVEHAEAVHASILNQISAVLRSIHNEMTQQAARTNPEFVAQRQPFLQNIDTQLEQARQWEPYLVSAALEARGFLEDEGIRQEYQRTVADLRREAKTTLDEVKAEATRTIEEARKLAKEIEDRARRTAARVSVEEAQRQFGEAQKVLNRKVWTWGGVSVLAIAGFIGTVIWFIYRPLPETAGWHVLYYAALRLALLSAVGALAGFSLRVLRAFMNLRERNLHRQRVANSVQAFVESAVTPEVRDFILAHLVDAVAAFGVSGLLTRETDTLGTPRVSVDTLSRLVGALTPRKEGG